MITIWKEQSEDDFISIDGDYMLRVEDLGETIWWCVYFKDEQIDFGDSRKISLAKEYAEQAMNKHIKKSAK